MVAAGVRVEGRTKDYGAVKLKSGSNGKPPGHVSWGVSDVH